MTDFTDEDMEKIMLHGRDFKKFYDENKLKFPKASLEELAVLYQDKMQKELYLEWRQKERQEEDKRTLVGKTIAAGDYHLTAIGEGLAKQMKEGTAKFVIGMLPQKYRERICEKWGWDERSVVENSAFIECFAGTGLIFTSLLGGTPSLLLLGYCMIGEGLFRLIIGKDTGHYLPSLLTKIPLSLTEKITGPLLPEKKPNFLLPYLYEEQQKEKPKPALRQEGNAFVFSHLPGYDKEISFYPEPLDHGSFRTMDDWWNYSTTNEEGIVVPSLFDFYQVLHALFEMKDKREYGECAEACIEKIKPYFEKYPPRLCTKITYSGLKTTIEHLRPDRTSEKKQVTLPEGRKKQQGFTYTWEVLAPAQYASRREVNKINEEYKPALEALLGEKYETAGAVLQMLSPVTWFTESVYEASFSIPRLANREGTKWGGIEFSNKQIDLFSSGNEGHAGPAFGIRFK